ncbi:STM4013/SEN3800 family hydrolase [Kineosporia sp. NBRC 101731]|uniref:STM4013/SEN3800 family hydrolase n=1 Tax=Kineosporia sp. NBRC 101731 TaxID=3032199 RepID=UPI0024A36226|nr:STM4013/SEN3800 family hydrolase [Kineosporia sp. NBRC 101731]GLY33465.1 membrane protein [Kineosporia sp. NBRC 101731]
MISGVDIIGRERRNILLVTMDSLRFDAAAEASRRGLTPRIVGFLSTERWEERRTPGTFTFPAHQALFAGFLPKLYTPEQPPRLWECQPPAGKPVHPTTLVLPAADLLSGLRALGYLTLCIGGVTYFSSETPLGSVLPRMFDQAFWQPLYGSTEPDSTRHQVDKVLALAQEHHDRPVFMFLNISATHVPLGHYLPAGHGPDSVEAQIAALSYVDLHLGRLLDALPETGDWLVILTSDHGEAFGEDGFTGHGIAHPTVLKVPFAQLLTP